MIQKNYKLEIKSTADDGTFEGYASVFGNVDYDGDMIDKGAFKRTIDHSKGVVPILWQHDRAQPVGWNATAEEDGFGLKVSGQLMVDTEIGRTAFSFLKTGLALGGRPGLSIGFMVPKGGDYVKDGVRHFKEVALKEYSIVTFPANEKATATAAKSEEADTNDGAKDSEGMDNEKSGRAISAATAEKIKMAMDHIQKGLGHLEDLSTEPYTANDVNADNPVGGGKSENSGDPEDAFLHSLLELTRSVADKSKSA